MVLYIDTNPLSDIYFTNNFPQFRACISSLSLFFFFFKFLLSIYFWWHWVSIAAWDFSSCSEQELLFIVVLGLLIAVASLAAEHGSRALGFQ